MHSSGSHFVFTQTNDAQANEVAVYERGDDGRLAAIAARIRPVGVAMGCRICRRRARSSCRRTRAVFARRQRGLRGCFGLRDRVE